MRFAAQAAGFGTYDLDCLTGDIVLSPEMLAMAGLAPDRSPMAVADLEALIHPEDVEKFREKFRASLNPQGAGHFEDEFRLIRSDGSFRWARTQGRTVFYTRDGRQQPLAATGVVMNVTSSHQAQQELTDSREELAKLVDSAIDAIITVDSDQRILRFNPSAARMFGCSVAEAIGSPLDRFIPARHRVHHRKQVSDFARGDVSSRLVGPSGVFTGLRANGEEFPIEASIVKVEVGKTCRMTVFLRDISERVRAEDAIRRGRDDLELAVRGANIGIWHRDWRTGEVELSDRCRQILGIPPAEPVNLERLLATVHPDDRERVMSALRGAFEHGQEYQEEKRVVWPDGSIHWVESIGRQFYEWKGDKAVGMRGISLDITERKRHEEALRAWAQELERRVEERTTKLQMAKEALECSNLELQQFAFIAAHDLQSPLRSINGFAQLLKEAYKGRFDQEADHWLEQMFASTKRMHALVQDLLAYSRVESRGAPFKAVNFERLLDDVLATLEVPIRESEAEISRDQLPTVLGDRGQLAQVLQNLIDNGIKYHDRKPPRIHISAERQAGAWLFSVKDEGIGIRDKHHTEIFDIFRRLHTQQEYPGTGIGLAVCRRVVQRHGGKIWVESCGERGSTFYFTLPDQEPNQKDA